MKMKDESLKKIVEDLTERAKELNCLYKIEEILKDSGRSLEEIFRRVLEVIPPGWQYVHLCKARIIYNEKIHAPAPFQVTEWRQQADILLDDQAVGRIEVYYTAPVGSGSPFLPEEQKLLDTIADRISHFIFQARLKASMEEWEQAKKELESRTKKEWEIIVDLLEKTESSLFTRISRKMLNYLCWIGVDQARSILQCVGMKKQCDLVESIFETNKPSAKININSKDALSNLTFAIAAQSISDEEMLGLIRRWLKEDKVGFLVKALENQDTSLGDIADAISRYHHLEDEVEITTYSSKNIKALLIQRLFTEQLEFVNISKDYISVDDFFDILSRTVYPQNSHGKLGGKSAGLFVASQIIKKYKDKVPEFGMIKIPKTWYITSDTLQYFLSYNDLEESLEQKYKQIEQIREEYPNIVQVFKNSNFPPDIMNWLSMALDDLGEKPIIVRSSSLLEDRVGTAFSGKYKSLFLANRGNKSERLAALMDAIAEIYASVFAPDPIEYRKEMNLINFHEEMAIMIQEVVGTRVGKYFFPAFAGVAFCNNEFRWSPRIKREDGLIRLVPGLGTRAVDRLSNDYPRLVAPGQPQLSVNVSADEIRYYSPREIDVINLETNSFETIGLKELLRQYGAEYPGIDQIVSVFEEDHILNKLLFQINFAEDELAATFSGIISKTPFIGIIKKILDLLKEKLGTPVDIEFASDGKDFYLLQCRSQSFSRTEKPAPIPRNLPESQILFTARRFVSNGKISNITHLVYVDADKYAALATIDELKQVGRAVGRLNSLLPKRQFILMAPGRWGSRGDIRLGVNVTYSDISNTAMLVEIARQKGNYVPDLSFGTHFFQDLVESSIRYLPLYPDDPEIIFNERFFSRAGNILAHLVPEYTHLQDTVKVIDVPREAGGRQVKVLMNAELEEAMAVLAKPSVGNDSGEEEEITAEEQSGNYWRWRLRMAEHIAGEIDARHLGVAAMYVIGSTKNGTASPGSDIDLLVHFRGSEQQRRELLLWLEGWSLCLAEINRLKTGYKTSGLLDVHLITDEDIEKKTSYAAKIDAVTDPARALPLSK